MKEQIDSWWNKPLNKKDTEKYYKLKMKLDKLKAIKKRKEELKKKNKDFWK